MQMLMLVIGALLAGIGAIDAVLGQTGRNPLPDALANKLTKGLDFVLILGGVTLIFLGRKGK